MDSGMIGKIQKAKQYAEERDRIHIQSFSAVIDGTNNQNTVTYENGSWRCSCNFFQSRGRCSHTMAMEILLEPMLAPS